MDEHVAYVRSALQESPLHEYPTIEFAVRRTAPTGELNMVQELVVYAVIVLARPKFIFRH